MTTELENERHITDRIFWLALTCLIETGLLAGVAMITKSTAAVVAVVVTPLFNIATAAGASLYTRRTRSAVAEPVPSATDGSADVYT